MSTIAPTPTENDPKRPISLLSLDAGGPQGISQLLILKDVMERLSKDDSGDSQGTVRRPCEVFDMIGGVGTGGLIAIFLVVLEMAAKDALDEFTNFMVEVFKDVDHDPRKQTEKLVRVINDLLEKHGIPKDSKLILRTAPSPVCKLMVPVMYKSHVGVPCILRNYISNHEPPVDLTIAEAMLATCSTPPTFTPMMISKDFATFEYVGGDSGLSNPTREILAEAHRTFGDDRTVSCLLSIGCGRPGVNPVPSAAGGNARIEFLERVALDSEKTAGEIGYQMGQLTVYHRLSVHHGLERNQTREWKEPTVITAHTTNWLNDLNVVEIVERCVNTIMHGDGFTTLEQLARSGGAKALSPPLPPLAANYVERKAPMEFIEKVLFDEAGRIKSGSKRIVVTGIGGCGKTQLIRKFIEKYRDLFVTTFFIDGSSPDTIQRDVVRHVRSLGGAHSQKSFDESMTFLSQALSDGERLLIIDNVDDPTLDLAPFFPRWRNGAVIVTSRNHSRGQLNPASHLQLDVMTVDESVELLISGSGQPWPPAENDRVLAMSVAEELGCHPIALVQGVSYMYNTGCSPRNYVTLLRNNRDRLLRDHPATSQVDMRYKTAFAAFDASYSILPPKAQGLWHLLSFFRWQKFPIELITLAALDGFSHERHPFLDHGEEFELGKEYLKEIFYNSGQWDPLELQSILATLRSHSLVTIVSAGNMALLQMHPLVHEWGRHCIPDGSLRRVEAAAVRLLCCGASEQNYSMMQYLSSHVEGLCSAPEHLHVNNVASFALILEQSGMYDKAVILKGIVHGMVKRELGPNHSETVTASTNLATTYHALGRYSEAEELRKEVLRERKQELGADHPDTILASSHLATTCHVLGRYAEAEELYKQVLKQRKQVLGAYHPDTIDASSHLATTYHALGRYAEVEKLNVEVLKQRKKMLGAGHPDTIEASANLAATYHSLGRHAKAEELQKEVLRQRMQALGADHPHTIDASSHLATTYHALGRYAEVEKLNVEVLKQRKKMLGAGHPDTIEASANLAVTYHELGRHAEAEELQKEVLRHRKQALGSDHPDTIRASDHLAATYHALSRHAEAEELQTRVLQQRECLLGVDHPDTVRASAQLATTYYALRRYAEAEELDTKVLKKRTAILGERHPETIHSMLYLAQMYNKTQRQSEAFPLAQKALQSALETLGDVHPLSQRISEFVASLPELKPARTTRGSRFAIFKKRGPRT